MNHIKCFCLGASTKVLGHEALLKMWPYVTAVLKKDSLSPADTDIIHSAKNSPLHICEQSEHRSLHKNDSYRLHAITSW